MIILSIRTSLSTIASLSYSYPTLRTEIKLCKHPWLLKLVVLLILTGLSEEWLIKEVLLEISTCCPVQIFLVSRSSRTPESVCLTYLPTSSCCLDCRLDGAYTAHETTLRNSTIAESSNHYRILDHLDLNMKIESFCYI